MHLSIKQNVSLADHTTLHVGGVADYFVEVTTKAELKSALQYANAKALPSFVLGGGSNVLFPDEGFRGLVIKNAVRGLVVSKQDGEITVEVGAGENWDEFVSQMCEQGYWGLENLSAIPGTVGATPIQNVGAYGVEVSGLIAHVRAMHKTTLEEKVFTNAECQFAYRDSYFKSPAGKDWVVLTVTFALSTKAISTKARPSLHYADLHSLQGQAVLTPNKVRDAVITIRSQKFPDWSEVGTAGSFFKNPIISNEQYQELQKYHPDIPAHQTSDGGQKLALGWILDKVCGLKGYCVNDVCLYQKQALVLVNKGKSAEAISLFAQQVADTVFEKTKIKIEMEVLQIKN